MHGEDHWGWRGPGERQPELDHMQSLQSTEIPQTDYLFGVPTWMEGKATKTEYGAGSCEGTNITVYELV